ncbi:MAG: hypothetical protein JWO32_1919 [Bacteroidetes bacterium]|nr:hypothetical protein [Bacteroidota bacterium]
MIKVKKEQNLEKVYFDNTELKLIPIDRFGNPRDNRIVTYKFWIKGKDKNFQGSANKLAPEMVQALNKLKKATKIYFTEIQVEDENGHLIKLPDVYETWFPDCKNCGKPGGKK